LPQQYSRLKREQPFLQIKEGEEPWQIQIKLRRGLSFAEKGRWMGADV